MPFTIWWRAIAWPWLKKNWYWVLLGPLALVVVLMRRPKKIEVTSTQLSQADVVKEKAQAKKDAAFEQAAEDLSEEVEVIQEERDERVEDLIEEQERHAKTPPTGTDLTDFMKKVGKDVR